MVLTVSNGCKITLECLQEEHKQQQGSGEEATGGVDTLSTSFQDKAKYPTSSPLNNSTSFTKLEPLDIKFLEWPPKLEPQQLNLKEPSQLKTISIETLDASADSVDSCFAPRGSIWSAESSSIAYESASPVKSWYDNSAESLSIPGYVPDHRTEMDGDLSMSLYTSGHVREEHGTDADEEDEGEEGGGDGGGENSTDNLSLYDHHHHHHSSENTSNHLLPVLEYSEMSVVDRGVESSQWESDQ